MKSTDAGGGESAFVITRVVDAPRELVWRMYTQADHLKNWFGPKGFPMTHCSMDLRVGGMFHYCLQMPGGGSEMWGRWIFRAIEPPRRLVTVTSFSDAEGGVTRHPLAPGWPLHMLGETLFDDEADGKTRITVTTTALDASEAEIATFKGGFASMTQGWSGTFQQFSDYLATLK
ncbi:SRPBCC domain-containing protein [Ferrovibrio sp.]|uniref:SRPBCC family protein n=1 Tax=Ferrovibrio sp. TaxID=1917215 RepID=UPI0035B1FBB4